MNLTHEHTSAEMADAGRADTRLQNPPVAVRPATVFKPSALRAAAWIIFILLLEIFVPIIVAFLFYALWIVS